MASKSFRQVLILLETLGDLQSKIKQVTGEIRKLEPQWRCTSLEIVSNRLVKTVTDLQTRASCIGSKSLSLIN